jgi:predicted unusual protein kinase regulating ubiquinone biosynthesis (AarF/ABC1/UbiB family)
LFTLTSIVDLHPGNVIYSEYSKDSNSTPASGNKSSLLKSASSDNEWVLSFIDTGLVANLSKEDRTNFIELFAAVIKNDGTRVGQLMIERSRGGGANCINPKEFAEEIGELVHSVHRTGAVDCY